MQVKVQPTYQSAGTQMVQPPPEGQRQVGPPPLNVANLLAMQEVKKPRADKPDSEVWDPNSKQVLMDWRDIYSMKANIDLSWLRKLLDFDRETLRAWANRQFERPENVAITMGLIFLTDHAKVSLRAIYGTQNGKLVINTVVATAVGVTSRGFHLPGRWFGLGDSARFRVKLDVKIEGLTISHDGNNPVAKGVLIYTVSINGIFTDPVITAEQGFEIIGRELKVTNANYGQ
jgi:hypothetical protein